MIFLEVFNLLRDLAITRSANLSLILNRSYSILLYFILIIFSDLVKSRSNKIAEEIETDLTGFLLSTKDKVDLKKIADHLNISENTVLTTFLKIKSKGMLKEFIFDSESKEIIPPPSSILISSAEDLILKAKLLELERLKAEGKISERAYEELKKEIERGRP